MELTSGTLLERGKYLIISTLGRGGFGITYLAEQTMAKRRVCIKEFFPKDFFKRDEGADSISLLSQSHAGTMSRFKEKFIKEAQTIAALDHPNIIHILDVFEENNTAYYVMEYVEGGSLSDVVKRGGAVAEGVAIKYIRDIASALGYIHCQKINHLDVKPGNILLRPKEDQTILIDFGLAKHYDAGGEQTSSTPVGISHGYAPIEQYKSGGVSSFSPATDIYGLGATLYYLVTGTVPPSATDMGREGVEVPSNLSTGVQRAIKEAMNYWREDRPQSIDDFLKLLDDEQGVVAPIAENTIIDVEPKHDDESTIISVEPTQTAQPAPQPKNEPKPKNERKSKRGLWLGIFLFVLAAVASFILFGGGSSKEEGAPKSAVATVDTLASSNDSLNLAKPGVDTLQLNESPKQEDPKPELIVESESEVILPNDGGSGEIKYTITNPVDGESVKYATDAKWLTLNHNDGVVSCTAQANTTGKKRSATVTLTYCDQSVKVNISQDTSTPPNNEIWYTSPDGKVVKPSKAGKDIFGAEIESNTYKNGKGIIKFKGNVTTIGDRAFEYSSSLTSVTIPDSVTTIGYGAFSYCSNLKEFKGGFAFSKGRCLIINGKLVAFAPAGITNFIIPDSVTTIGEWAFYNCDSLESVTIPNSVKTIGNEAFANCNNLTGVTIPDSVTTIGEWAFGYCMSLTSVTIPNSVMSIGYCAFAYCSNLTSVTIPNSVTTIGDSAFYRCSSLTSVTIPNSVTMIERSTFYDCNNLTSVTIPNSVTTIGEDAFSYCNNLTSVTIPNSVKTIGNGAFSSCESLKSVTIPNGVTTIGDYAFAWCINLKSVTIPNSVTTIGDSAFSKSYNLSVETKNNIRVINPNAKF